MEPNSEPVGPSARPIQLLNQIMTGLRHRYASLNGVRDAAAGLLRSGGRRRFAKRINHGRGRSSESPSPGRSWKSFAGILTSVRIAESTWKRKKHFRTSSIDLVLCIQRPMPSGAVCQRRPMHTLQRVAHSSVPTGVCSDRLGGCCHATPTVSPVLWRRRLQLVSLHYVWQLFLA
jgi:hypothetical protein